MWWRAGGGVGQGESKRDGGAGGRGARQRELRRVAAVVRVPAPPPGGAGTRLTVILGVLAPAAVAAVAGGRGGQAVESLSACRRRLRICRRQAELPSSRRGPGCKHRVVHASMRFEHATHHLLPELAGRPAQQGPASPQGPAPPAADPAPPPPPPPPPLIRCRRERCRLQHAASPPLLAAWQHHGSAVPAP